MAYVDEIRVIVEDDKPQVNERRTGSSQLHNSLLDLLSQTKQSKQTKQAEEDTYYFGEYEEEKPAKQKKKDKKKKKKNKGSLLEELEVDVIYGGDFVKDKYIESLDIETIEEEDTNLIDVDRVFEDDDYDDEMESIIYDQKKAYKKNKKSDNQFRKEFAEELTLLYGLLDETNSFGSDLDKIYKAMTSSKTRGFSKYTSDIITSILSTKQTKLSVLKEITGVKKTIADLALKEAKNSGDKDGGSDISVLAANYLGNIVKHGRQDVVKALTGEETYYDTDSEAINEFVNSLGDYEDDDEREQLNQELMDELDGGSYRRSAQADTYIKNEYKEVKILIQRDISSGRWDFVAIDKNSNMVLDYPLPSKQDVSPVSFTTDGTFGTDKFGRLYKVIEVC